MEVIKIKDTVTLKDQRRYYLAVIPFSLEDKLFWTMINEIRERANEEKFFWDESLKVWVVEEDALPLVTEILGTYYPQSKDYKVSGLKEEIRSEVKSKNGVEDGWLT